MVTSNRQVVGVLLMGLLLVLAGCNGGSGGTNGTDATTTAMSGETMTTAATTTDGGGASGDMEMDTSYEFTTGESYTYDISFAGTEPIATTWEVTAAGEGGVQVSVSEAGDVGRATTLSGESAADVFDATGGDPVAGSFGIARGTQVLAMAAGLDSSGETTLGADELPGEYDWSSVTLTVEEEAEIAGVACRNVSATFQGADNTFSGCFNADFPFPIYVEGESSGVTQTFALVDFERPDPSEVTPATPVETETPTPTPTPEPMTPVTPETPTDGEDVMNGTWDAQINNISECGQTCRTVNYTVSNIGANATTNTSIQLRAIADGDEIYSNETAYGTINASSSLTIVEDVEVGRSGGFILQDTGGDVTIEINVGSTNTTASFSFERNVA